MEPPINQQLETTEKKKIILLGSGGRGFPSLEEVVSQHIGWSRWRICVCQSEAKRDKKMGMDLGFCHGSEQVWLCGKEEPRKGSPAGMGSSGSAVRERVENPPRTESWRKTLWHPGWGDIPCPNPSILTLFPAQIGSSQPEFHTWSLLILEVREEIQEC